MQGGFGLEYIVSIGIGIKLFGEYNQVFSNQETGLIVPGEEAAFFRIVLGTTLYQGRNKSNERLMNRVKTVINSNLIK